MSTEIQDPSLGAVSRSMRGSGELGITIAGLIAFIEALPAQGTNENNPGTCCMALYIKEHLGASIVLVRPSAAVIMGGRVCGSSMTAEYFHLPDWAVMFQNRVALFLKSWRKDIPKTRDKARVPPDLPMMVGRDALLGFIADVEDARG